MRAHYPDLYSAYREGIRDHQVSRSLFCKKFDKLGEDQRALPFTGGGGDSSTLLLLPVNKQWEYNHLVFTRLKSSL